MKKIRFLLVTVSLFVILDGCQQDDEDPVSAIDTDEIQSAAPAEYGLATPLKSLQSALASKDPRERWHALSELKRVAEIPLEKRADLLMEAMRQEIRNPDPAAPIFEGAYLPAHDFLMLWQTRTLGDLAKEAPGIVASLVGDTSGEERERAILAMGYAGNQSYTPQIRILLAESTHWQVRNSAAFILGEMKAQEAAPELMNALKDAHQIKIGEAGKEITIYPVRQKAQGALKKLGFVIEKGPGRNEFQVKQQD